MESSSGDAAGCVRWGSGHYSWAVCLDGLGNRQGAGNAVTRRNCSSRYDPLARDRELTREQLAPRQNPDLVHWRKHRCHPLPVLGAKLAVSALVLALAAASVGG